MSVSVTISGEIIESQTYLSNYFVTLTGDQTIYGNNTFNRPINASSLIFNTGKITATTLDISSSILTFSGSSGNPNEILVSNGNKPFWQDFRKIQDTLFGVEIIDSASTSGTITFIKPFNLVPCVTITQYSNRLVPLCVTNVTTTEFEWASASSNVGKIMWSAGPKYVLN
jgi:hypothetical protein